MPLLAGEANKPNGEEEFQGELMTRTSDAGQGDGSVLRRIADDLLRTEPETATSKRENESLRQAKEDWEQTFNTIPDFVAILDDQHRVVRANRAMAERLGVTTEQCVGLHCYEAIHGTAQPPEFCPHARTCWDGREHTTEVHEPNLGGDFLVSTTPRFDEQGRLIGSVHVARDITKRKRAEERLQQSERFQAAILNSLVAHIAVLDKRGHISAVNEPWLRFARENGVADMKRIGIGENYLEAGRAATKAGDPYAAAALEGIEAVLQGRQQQFVIEYPCHSSDRPHWFLMYVTANAEDIGGAIIAHTDITERKQAEETLRESEERLRLALEAARMGWWHLDLATNKLVADDRCKSLCGLPPETPPSMELIFDVMFPEDRLRVQDQVLEAKESPGIYENEFRVVWPDSSIHWIFTRGQALPQPTRGWSRTFSASEDMPSTWPRMGSRRWKPCANRTST